MGTLVLLMWIADIADKLQLVFIIMGIVCGFIAWTMYMDDKDIRVQTTVAVCCFVFFALVPSKHTVYGYVVLYAGKEIVESQVGQKSYQALDSILDNIIKSNKDILKK